MVFECIYLCMEVWLHACMYVCIYHRSALDIVLHIPSIHPVFGTESHTLTWTHWIHWWTDYEVRNLLVPSYWVFFQMCTTISDLFLISVLGKKWAYIADSAVSLAPAGTVYDMPNLEFKYWPLVLEQFHSHFGEIPTTFLANCHFY